MLNHLRKTERETSENFFIEENMVDKGRFMFL